MTVIEAVGIFLGVLGGVPVVVLAVSKSIDILKKFQLSHLWRFNNHGWALIKPQYEGRKARIEDVIAAEKLREALTENKIDFIDSDDSKPVPADRNVVFICGPDANKASARIASTLRLSFEYRYDPSLKRPYIYDHRTGAKLWSPSDDSGQPRDLALVAKLSSKPGPYIYVLCWGIHGPGTTGAAQMLLEPEFIKALRKGNRNSDFVAIVGVPYKSFDSTGTPSLLTLRTGAEVYRSTFDEAHNVHPAGELVRGDVR